MEYSDYIKNKSIIIIGPSANVKYDYDSLPHKEYDIVCRLNNHYKFKEDDLATHVIYHNLRGQFYDASDLKYFADNNILLRMRRYSSNITKLKMKYFHSLKIKIPHLSTIAHIDTIFGINTRTNKSWNIGGVAILDILRHNINSLNVIGFDWHRTIYNHDQKLSENHFKVHDPESQLKVMRKIYKASDKFFAYGKTKEILESDESDE